VAQAGGRTAALPADIADYNQVTEAARTVEEAFGAIDVWINIGFTSVFEPFWEIQPEKFGRVTEVS
jgi:NAD(P)-dependent dehydrogenase (short-subunit alcohol dehydrogenase family)